MAAFVIVSNLSDDFDLSDTTNKKIKIIRASDTVSGVVELATPDEAKAGVDTERALTPAALKAAIDAYDARPRHHASVEIAASAGAISTDAAFEWRDAGGTVVGMGGQLPAGSPDGTYELWGPEQPVEITASAKAGVENLTWTTIGYHNITRISVHASKNPLSRYTTPIGSLPVNLLEFIIIGTNTIGGDIARAPSGLTYLAVGGQNTIYGDIGSAPSGLTDLTLNGQTTVTGDIRTLPAGLQKLGIGGKNTVSGDIGGAPAGLTSFSVIGQNTISGDIEDAPAGLTSFSLIGKNTIGGDIADAPAGLTYVNIGGQNTISGDIGDAPAGLTNLQISGQNTIGGDLAGAPAGLTFFTLHGNNGITAPTDTWPFTTTGFRRISVQGTGLTQQGVDNVLRAAATVTSWSGGYVDLRGNNAAPSDPALADAVRANGATVLTN